MKKIYLLLPVFAITTISCKKTDHLNKELHTTAFNTPAIQRGLGIDLNVTLDVDNTADEWMQAIEASLQSAHIGVKIGGYGGGTDTAIKWANIIEDVANALGITVEELEDMNGIDLLDALFPDISNDQITILTSGNTQVLGVVNDASNSFQIYVGPSGAADIITDHDLVLSFQLN